MPELYPWEAGERIAEAMAKDKRGLQPDDNMQPSPSLTVRETVEKRLVDKGMWPKEAKQVVDLVIEQVDQPLRWDESVEGYPPQLIVVLCVIADKVALKWIDENCPLAFYRSMFVP